VSKKLDKLLEDFKPALQDVPAEPSVPHAPTLDEYGNSVVYAEAVVESAKAVVGGLRQDGTPLQGEDDVDVDPYHKNT
jgi:hypothetical protein